MPFRKQQEALDLTEGDMTDLDLTATSRMQDLARRRRAKMLWVYRHLPLFSPLPPLIRNPFWTFMHSSGG